MPFLQFLLALLQCRDKQAQQNAICVPFLHFAQRSVSFTIWFVPTLFSFNNEKRGILLTSSGVTLLFFETTTEQFHYMDRPYQLFFSAIDGHLGFFQVFAIRRAAVNSLVCTLLNLFYFIFLIFIFT